MLRTTITLLLACCLAAAGCNSNPPTPAAPAPAASPPQPSPTAKSPSPQATSSPAPKATTQDAPPAPTSPTAENGPLRDLAARLIESDGQGGWRINEKAATELEKLGPEGIDKLWPLLAVQAEGVRRGAAFYLLGQFDSQNSQQVAAFSALLDDSDRTIRGFGLSALQQMRREDQIAALPRLATMLSPAREERADRRVSIARFCGTLKADAAAALDALITAATTDPEPGVRGACLVAIKEVASPDKAVDPLAQGLADKDAGVRLVAAVRLRQLGNAAAPASRPLASALADSDERIRDAAATTLILIGPPAVEPLTAQLASPNIDARKFSLACLAKIGPAAKSALPAVEKCKQDSDAEVRKLAEAAAKRIGGN